MIIKNKRTARNATTVQLRILEFVVVILQPLREGINWGPGDGTRGNR